MALPRRADSRPVAVQTDATAQRHIGDSAVPSRLKIPVVGIDAPVTAVGLTSDGDMQAPNGAHDTAWYKLGAHPGNSGTAVIAGHYGRWQNGDGSVFDPLNQLKVGDELYVVDTNGLTSSFTVRATRVFGRGDDARSVFTSPDTKAHLNLITCQGIWKAAAKTYADRLVVFADLN